MSNTDLQRFMETTEFIDGIVDTIIKKTGGKRNVRGSIDCPKCKGIMNYAVNYNGHIRVCCETEDCLRWIQ